MVTKGADRVKEKRGSGDAGKECGKRVVPDVRRRLDTLDAFRETVWQDKIRSEEKGG